MTQLGILLSPNMCIKSKTFDKNVVNRDYVVVPVRALLCIL